MAWGQETPFTTQYQRTLGIWASGLSGELVREREGVWLRLSPIKAQSATTKATTKYPRQSNLKIPMIMLAPSLLTGPSARELSPHAFAIGRPSETKLQFFPLRIFPWLFPVVNKGRSVRS